MPGAGLLLAGRPLAGFGVGLAYAAALNAALAIRLLVPDDFPWTAFWSSLAAATAYVVAQFLLLRAHGDAEAAGTRAERRTALAELLAAVREGRADSNAARRLEALAETDLHVAYRLAQSASLNSDPSAVRAAWERVRLLDPHHIYRTETSAALGRMRNEPLVDGEAR